MAVVEFGRLLRYILIASIISSVIVMPIIELLERKFDKANKDIDKMLEDLKKEREWVEVKKKGESKCS